MTAAASTAVAAAAEAPPAPTAASTSRARTVLFAAADDPVCEAAFDFALDHVLRPGDALVLLHVAVAEPVAAAAAAQDDDRPSATAAAADDPSSPSSPLAARAYSEALPAADYFYAPARAARSLEAVQAVLDRRFLRKLADVREGQLRGAPRLVVARASADAATVARLVLEHAGREGADMVVVTGRTGVVAAASAHPASAEGGTKKGFWGRLFAAAGGGRRRGGDGGGGLPTTSRRSARARDDALVAAAPVGAAGRLILRKAKCEVVVLRPVVLPDDSGRKGVGTARSGDVEAAAAAAAARAGGEAEAPEEEEEEEDDDEALEEAEADRLPDTFEVVEYAALAAR